MNTLAKSSRLAAQELRIEAWNIGGNIPFPVDPFAIAERLGIKVHFEKLGADTAGFIIRRPGEPVVRAYLNSSDASVRQRFTMAHELGHFAQHRDEAEMGYVDERAALASAGIDRSEIWANEFAAELLMPAATVSKWWAEGKSPEEMAKRFGVSSAALGFRLQNLGLRG